MPTRTRASQAVTKKGTTTKTRSDKTKHAAGKAKPGAIQAAIAKRTTPPRSAAARKKSDSTKKVEPVVTAPVKTAARKAKPEKKAAPISRTEVQVAASKPAPIPPTTTAKTAQAKTTIGSKLATDKARAPVAKSPAQTAVTRPKTGPEPTAASKKTPQKKSVAKAEGPKRARVRLAAPEPAKALVELPPMAPPKKKLTLNIPAILLEGDQPPGSHPGGPGARYSLGRAALPGGEMTDDLALPESYGTRKIWLVPRDPQWLYAHWDFDAPQQREYNLLSRDGHLMLRIHDFDRPEEPVAEIHVHPESRSWFAHVGKGGGRYFAVLGFRDKFGEWHEINRSGFVATPPDSLSEEVEAEFFTQPAVGPSTTATVAPPPAAQSVPAATPEARVETTVPPVPEGYAPSVDAVAGLIEMVREYFVGEPDLARVIEAVFDSGAPGLPEKIELPPPAEFAKWTPAQQEALARVISMDAVREVWAGSHPTSIALVESSERKRRLDLASVAAIPPGGPGPAIPAAPAAISSPHGVPARERSFWFNVNAELVVYGATEPTARVTIGGRIIRLRRDGTFSYRFALPDGEYQLPITAESADGFEARHASLHFARGTEYHGDVGAHPQDPRLQTPAPEHTV